MRVDLQAALVALAFAASLLLSLGLSSAMAARLNVTIDLSSQMMQVQADDHVLHDWIVSTARRGYRTPIGTFRPLRLERVWYSTVYDNAPMPYSVFFHRGYAIHGTTEISKLGRPVSHGCVRLHPDNARMLFELIRRYGGSATTIVVRP
jgi:lipoprotein-anchoring transpeptidase ErfK/SrfK